jgi:hypothetical protein
MQGSVATVFSPGRFSMYVEAEENDPVVAGIIALLRQHGREPYMKRYPSAPYEHPTLYQERGKRVFEPEDFAKAEWFLLFTEIVIGMGGRHGQTNTLELDHSRITKQPIGRNTLTSICT